MARLHSFVPMDTSSFLNPEIKLIPLESEGNSSKKNQIVEISCINTKLSQLVLPNNLVKKVGNGQNWDIQF